jgi:heme o synthase
MGAEPTMAVLNVARRSRAVRLYATLSDYWALTKPEVNFLILITTFAGFYLGYSSPFDGGLFLLLMHTLFGTLLVASGAGALNQYLERRFDTQMRRTTRRPLAAGRLEPVAALYFGVLLSFVGVLYLAVAVNPLASLLAVLTLTSYLFVYTPLKRKTPLCTLVGAFPGAIPPLIGWAAARGRLEPEAWVLYAVVFLWQFPHFMAIAWMYREDYSRAGYLVLPPAGLKEDLRDRFVIWQTIVPGLALIPVSLIPIVAGKSSLLCVVAASMTSSIFSYYCFRLAFVRSNLVARQLLVASIVYIPVVFVVMTLSRT